jgi:hypothetical protein
MMIVLIDEGVGDQSVLDLVDYALFCGFLHFSRDTGYADSKVA